MAKKRPVPGKHVGELPRVEEARGDTDLYKEELKETLVEADAGSSGVNEERDIDDRLSSEQEAPAAKKGKKKR